MLIFCAAARRLRPRDQWIGWTDEQRRRRLPLVANNTRFLLLPDQAFPNLASKALRLAVARLSADWQSRYGHPVLVVETFVDPAKFSGTLYRASGWHELSATAGCGRQARDYYVRHDQPKRLFCRELVPNACRSLQAEHVRPALAVVEAHTPPRPTQTAPQWRSLCEYFKALPDYRTRFGAYPLYSLLALATAAHLAGAPRGQKDRAAFAARLSQRQRRALGIRRHRRSGRYPAPSQPTFCRLYAHVDALVVERAVLAFQRQLRGPLPPDELIVLDGKEPRHTGGQCVRTAVTVSSQHYLGSTLVADKTNEIPAARELCQRLDLAGRAVSRDALHTQADTARAGARARRRLPVHRQRQSTQGSRKQCTTRAGPAGSLPPPPPQPVATLARTVERNRGRLKAVRWSAPLSPPKRSASRWPRRPRGSGGTWQGAPPKRWLC